MKKVITSNERLQLLGLLTLGQQHQKIVDQTVGSIERIIDDLEGGSLLTDAIWEYKTAIEIDEVLRNMGIEVGDVTS